MYYSVNDPVNNMKIAIVSVTPAGDIIAEKLKDYYYVHIYSKNNIENFDLKQITHHIMNSYRALIFISSTGIAVRAIANFIKSKDTDPAVVVIDSCGKFVISLLSGHLGGANELAEKIASKIKAVPVITTATDNIGIMAPDLVAKKYKLIIDDLRRAKDIAALLVSGERVGFEDERNIIPRPKGYVSKSYGEHGIVFVTHRNKINTEVKFLKLIRKDIVLGVGCRKNFPTEIMKDTILKVLKSRNIDKRSVAVVATVDIKASEPAVIYLKDYLNCDVNIFSGEEIKAVQHKFQGSDFVEKSIGVRSVCEPCAYLAGAEQLTEKMKLSGMTLCIGILRNIY